MSPTSLLHPLDTNNGTFIERKSLRRLSISSDLSDEEIQPVRRSNSHNWSHLLSQFDSQPDLIKLIQSCKEEEERRREEETKMKLKEYQVLRQMQHIQDRQYFDSKSQKEFNLQLPPLSFYK
ncbi:uncharacterized protein EV154DRAFT_491062 [Mucor mucedo]|uniref:uncharacterized protein n=1 Tax=Mucor mucedo TaxID=29922 RepID=UPI00221FEB8B|nr:uncharacterized protein EV154DRAFT_491062 [Mucor mucedo]KAI7896870.1 hypothetical protein EV154DRAFT_491062 [Mucor mucedo]